ncbi:biotin-dependent carboxyltransferase family protein [Methylocystis heyeri]|uniref:5-oxoprolinase/urea amidolyase family protein n=1 Tax=Methylocystis heyeri TaxID=391905 RepID=A0A6B8KJN7_9HYPH|nr:biotin-dependent carboxyltransferase family protein [Methylocystis heyeri]QGM47291.1 5-oxoprolinase/urea amidolyase family protein [Methylocystis heyeri]
MKAALRILSAGPGATIQDAGRRGFMRFGVTPAGPMDRGAFLAAAAAAGDAHGAAIETSLGGLELTTQGGGIGLAIAGGAFDLRLDGRALPAACAIALEPGARLSIRAGKAGAWCYVAPFGRFALSPVLGSLATHSRAAIGGLDGRMLRAGDILEIENLRPAPGRPLAIEAPWLEPARARIRVLLGPQDDYFSSETIEEFLSSEWRISPRCDRMAYRLEGPALKHLKGHDIVSDGLVFGAIQIPGDGAPLILMADRQPTGGYPKIAHVIGADLDALAQMRPGDPVMFESVSWDQAVAARRRRAERVLSGVELAPLKQIEPTSEFLLSRNLIGGVVDAKDQN